MWFLVKQSNNIEIKATPPYALQGNDSYRAVAVLVQGYKVTFLLMVSFLHSKKSLQELLLLKNREPNKLNHSILVQFCAKTKKFEFVMILKET